MWLARTIRSVRALLLGLFALAQVAGVSPLLYEHTLNVYETTPVASHHHVRVATTAPDADHHHGALDFHDQCCALHALAGPLPGIADIALMIPPGVAIPPPALVVLMTTDPLRLDRPPKPLPPI
jgi:hypothetical protein